MFSLFLGVDGTAQFPSYLGYQVESITCAFQGMNPSFPSAGVNFSIIHGPTKRYELSLTDAQFSKHKGLYLLYRENPLRPHENFYYIGSTVEEGHRGRIRKILSHANGYLGVNPGDNVLPISRFLRDECNKNLDNIRTIFIPLDMEEDLIRELEAETIKLFQRYYGHLVKNKTTTKGATRPIKRELTPALAGI